MPDTSEHRPRFRWPSLFQDHARPLFILNRAKRLRFVNAAWEKLTGEASADALGKACLRKGPTETLYRTLAPPGELAAKSVATIRRPAPSNKQGPPWWDVTFIKLTDTEGSVGYLGLIDVIATTPGQPAKSIPPFIGSLRKKHSDYYGFDLFAGASLEAERFLARLQHAAASTTPVWLHGEPGCGKETAARVIHHQGPRLEQPFVRLDCAGVQPYLIEAILFGTGGLANADRIGTLFLKNPAALPRDLQQKLSDWLLHSANAPRVISSSKESASEAVADGTLRPEYATSLCVIELTPLPLRNRMEDLPRIVERTLAHLGKPLAMGDDAEKILRGHLWPGNFRELRDVLASVRVATGSLLAAHLPRYLREKSLTHDALPKVPRPSLDAILAAVEKKLIEHTLAECHGNQTESAQRLGIHRARLLRRLEALGLTSAETE